MTKKAAILAVLALAGCAAADGLTGTGGVIAASAVGTGQCFEGAAVTNFNVRERQTLYVSTRQNYVFRLDTPPNCFSATTRSVAVTPFGGSSARICVGDQARVIVDQGGGPPLTCIAQVTGPIRDSAISGLTSRQD